MITSISKPIFYILHKRVNVPVVGCLAGLSIVDHQFEIAVKFIGLKYFGHSKVNVKDEYA
jgi:hypothetical protein